MCAAATLLALTAFLVAMIAAYYSVVLARDMERWRNLRDHPSSRNRRLFGPEDGDDWPPL